MNARMNGEWMEECMNQLWFTLVNFDLVKVCISNLTILCVYLTKEHMRIKQVSKLLINTLATIKILGGASISSHSLIRWLERMSDWIPRYQWYIIRNISICVGMKTLIVFKPICPWSYWIFELRVGVVV